MDFQNIVNNCELDHLFHEDWFDYGKQEIGNCSKQVDYSKRVLTLYMKLLKSMNREQFMAFHEKVSKKSFAGSNAISYGNLLSFAYNCVKMEEFFEDEHQGIRSINTLDELLTAYDERRVFLDQGHPEQVSIANCGYFIDKKHITSTQNKCDEISKRGNLSDPSTVLIPDVKGTISCMFDWLQTPIQTELDKQLDDLINAASPPKSSDQAEPRSSDKTSDKTSSFSPMDDLDNLLEEVRGDADSDFLKDLVSRFGLSLQY